MPNILIIEDQEDLNLLLAEALQRAGYTVTSAYNGPDGLQAIRSKPYDLILLDIMLPFLNGDTLLQEARTITGIPVIIISAKDQVSTKIDLLKLGADDYITKPFDLGEVAARVESSLRRSGKQSAAAMTSRYKDLVLDSSSKRATAAGAILELTAKEFRILELLMTNQGKVFTKANLYESLWGVEYLGDDNAVKTHMSNLRSKLKKAVPEHEYIETVWGLGYRLYKE
ncbi:response regulator transcription factor [Paenibacillus sp. FSL R7-0331]|uniref:response regulator transcription factor n=1 Tax=Paenibacillus sp. FSL R7-0331 TaxID=1536773 RepID=UPI0004F6BFE9|nr:response regulator transcription factor [Paenibacillus sp. FSL R7-0331]AIQ50808.1 chemotaxis protein CheY [Paenibacillus sp. FSL R7-0331]